MYAFTICARTKICVPVLNIGEHVCMHKTMGVYVYMWITDTYNEGMCVKRGRA